MGENGRGEQDGDREEQDNGAGREENGKDTEANGKDAEDSKGDSEDSSSERENGRGVSVPNRRNTRQTDGRTILYTFKKKKLNQEQEQELVY
jgi:hypothetical protein